MAKGTADGLGRAKNRFGRTRRHRSVAEGCDDCVFFTRTWGGQRGRYAMDGYHWIPQDVGLTPELIQAVIDGVGEKKG
ncbi:MAG: hypothetical protein QNJ30_12225 [Kiloniellales bacterium]|nr:hypothetical protein [Kiloniellales bacterium]